MHAPFYSFTAACQPVDLVLPEVGPGMAQLVKELQQGRLQIPSLQTYTGASCVRYVSKASAQNIHSLCLLSAHLFHLRHIRCCDSERLHSFVGLDLRVNKSANL